MDGRRGSLWPTGARRVPTDEDVDEIRRHVEIIKRRSGEDVGSFIRILMMYASDNVSGAIS